MRRHLLQFLALAPLPVVLALVIWSGGRPGQALTPPEEGVAARPAHKQSAAGLELPQVLPSGWRRSGQVERYDQQTLFDRINGAAPTYLEAGFVSLLGAEYLRPDVEEPVVVDCYEMGSPSQALGIYSKERDPSYEFIELGQQGYRTAGTLNFWQGRYYVKLAGYSEGEALDQALTALAADLAALLPGPAREPALELLSRLPGSGQLAHSAGYSHAPLAAVAGLSQAYLASYGPADASYQLFILRAADAQAAGARLAQVEAHYQAEKTPLGRSAAGQLQTLTLGRPPRGLILQRGALIAGALELPRPELLPEVRGQLEASLAEEP